MKKKPTDHEILTALNKIIRESQKPKKVELGIVDGLVTEQKQFKKELKSAYKYYGDVLEKTAKYKDQIKRYRDNLVTFITSMEGSIKRIEKSAKELGVNPKDISEIALTQKEIAEGRTFIKNINKRWL